jgi:hypothetical protein
MQGGALMQRLAKYLGAHAPRWPRALNQDTQAPKVDAEGEGRSDHAFTTG